MPDHAPVSCKEAVLPFKRFRTKEGVAVDSLLGPEMRSTGEVMGIDVDFGSAFSKAQQGGGSALPRSGAIFVSVANRDKRAMLFPVKRLVDLGFTILATRGTAAVLKRNGIAATVVRKITERDGDGAGGEVDRRPHPRRHGADGRQHAVGAGCPRRRLRHPRRDDERRQADHHDDRDARRRRARHRGRTDRGDPRQVAAGPRARPRPLRRGATTVAGHGGGAAHERAPAARPCHAGGRGGHRDPAGRRLPAPHPRGARRRRARPPGPVRRPRRRRRDLRRRCCAGRSRSTRSAPAAPTAALSRSSSSAVGVGTRWIVERAPHDTIDVVGPLGKAFPLPTDPGRLRPRRWRLRQRPALLARRRAARTWLSRRDGPRRGQ